MDHFQKLLMKSFEMDIDDLQQKRDHSHVMGHRYDGAVEYATRKAEEIRKYLEQAQSSSSEEIVEVSPESSAADQ